MTTTPDNTATTWRSLTDQLTPSQVDKLADAERRSPLLMPRKPQRCWTGRGSGRSGISTTT